MPLKKSRKGASKKSFQRTVSSNIAELTLANKSKSPNERRSREQIAAIGYSAARRGKKSK